MDITDFQNSQSLAESSQILLAAGVILKMAFGQVASVNSLCSSHVLSEKECKSAVTHYNAFLRIMQKSYQGYVDAAKRLKEQETSK